MIETLIGQRYRIKALIGEGGMASVYSALDEKLERRVAIKILHPHLARNPDIRERFLLEAKTVSGLDHPNILRVYDFSGLDSEQLWMVTEILYGEDLSEYVKSFPRSRMHFIVATLVAREVCRALNEAHKLHIVHRDIKPENIMMLTNGQLKLMDFGIAKVHRANATQTGIFMGSPSYMSPEQIRGTDVDVRADIYSLCVLYYEIITGSLPFVGKSTAEVINRIMVGRFTPPNMIVTDLPHTLNQVIIKGLKSNKEERFASVSEMAQELDQFLGSITLRESRTELEEFTLNRERFDDRLTQILNRPRLSESGPLPPEGSDVFRSKITRYQASYEQGRSTPDEMPHDPLSPLAPGAESPQATIMLDEASLPTLPPGPQSGEGLPEVPKPPVLEAKPRVPEAPLESTSSRQNPNEAAAPQRKVNTNPPVQNKQVVMRQPTQSPKHLRQTGGNFQSPLKGKTQPPKSPYNNARMTQKGYYREFAEDEPKSNKLGYIVIIVATLIAAAAMLYVVGPDKIMNRFKREGLHTELANKVRKARADKDNDKDESPASGEAPATETAANPPQSTPSNAQPQGPAPATTPSKPTETVASQPTETKTTTLPPDVISKRPAEKTPVKAPAPSKTPPSKTVAKAEPQPQTPAQPAKPDATLVNLPPDGKQDDKVPEAKSTDKNTGAKPAVGTGPGVLKLAALPAAEVYLDGKMYGTTNDKVFGSQGVKLDPGTYMLRLKRKGYKLEEQTIQIKPGEMRQLNFTLTKLAELVELSIHANKIPASVVIEENKAGGRKREMPLTKHVLQINLKPGSYRVIVSHEQESINRTIELTEENKSLTFNADFK